MRIALVYHSLVSDWNHGNAHFLRGVATELKRRGHELTILEPANGWSRDNLLREAGQAALAEFGAHFPHLHPTYYDNTNDLRASLEDQDLTIVHEWNDVEVIAAAGQARRNNLKSRLLFHDTHHRALTAPDEMTRYDLTEYDGVLAYGEAIAAIYRQRSWSQNVYVWHEAADTTIFKPLASWSKTYDFAWVGNWGDDERTAELEEYLLRPARDLKLRGKVHGVRYPQAALDALRQSGLDYGGWLPNFKVPEVFSASRFTVHVPRRPYATKLKGIPTIRPFEALACGVPLISAPWSDSENLFRPGVDFLLANDGEQMRQYMSDVLRDQGLASSLAAHGLETIRSRHTCAHRVNELSGIYKQLASSTELVERIA